MSSELKQNIIPLEKQLELLKRYQEKGDNFARNKLCKCYENLIYDIIHKETKNKNFNYDEDQLKLEVDHATLKAFDNFDPSKGNAITTYLTTCIKGCIKNYFNDESHTTQAYREFATKRVALINKYQQSKFKNPDEVEIYEMYKEQYNKDISFSEYISMLNSKPVVMDFDKPLTEDDEGEKKTAGDIIPDNSSSPVNYSYNIYYEEAISKLLKMYSGRDLEIVKMYYGVDYDRLNKSEIGRKVGLSRQTVTEKIHLAEFRLKGILNNSNK